MVPEPRLPARKRRYVFQWLDAESWISWGHVYRGPMRKSWWAYNEESAVEEFFQQHPMVRLAVVSVPGERSYRRYKLNMKDVPELTGERGIQGV